MKKVVPMIVVLAVLATGATAASLKMLPPTGAGWTNSGGAQYHINGISQDGKYVFGTMPLDLNADGTVEYYPTAIQWQTGTYTFYTAKGEGDMRGLGVTPSGGLVVATCVKTNGYLGAYANAGSPSLSYLKDSSGGSSVAQVGVMNAIALDANGDGWLAGKREKSSEYPALAWRITGGVINPVAAWEKGGVNGKLGLNSVSANGIAVGSDKSGRNGATDGPVLVDVANNGNCWKITTFNLGGFGDTRGLGNGISGNGAWATGYFYDDGTDDSLHTFRNNVAANTTEELMPWLFDGNGGLIQQSNGLDVADNGRVVGFSYRPVAGVGYRATVWNPGSTKGLPLEGMLASMGVDLSAWDYLERCTGISDDGLTITGRGVLPDGSYRAFVAVIPEPLTLALMALGGLMFARRRRA